MTVLLRIFLFTGRTNQPLLLDRKICDLADHCSVLVLCHDLDNVFFSGIGAEADRFICTIVTEELLNN